MNGTLQGDDFSKRDITLPILAAGAAVGLVCFAGCFLFPLVTAVVGGLDPAAWLQPTPVPCPPVPDGWLRVMDERFDTNANGWPEGEELDEYADTHEQVTEGVYRLTHRALQGYYSFRYPEIDNLKDFHLRATVQQVSGPPNGAYGLVFRHLGWNHYSFTISNSRRIEIYRHHIVDEQDWESQYEVQSEAVRPGEPNELTVLGRGDRFAFCLNGGLVTELELTYYSLGRLGITVAQDEAGDEAVFEFSDFVVHVPPQ